MAKFLKSFFTPSERKGVRCEEGEERGDFTPPLDDRRKLSISRSGRMKQANKKRHSLSLDVYGETNKCSEKPKSMEYYVNNLAMPMPIISDTKSQRRHSGDPQTNKISEQTQNNQTKAGTDVKTPAEEIDRAFEIIDKVS